MRILVISNFYPPHHIGGYELGCHDVVEELKTRGHNVHVLTSTYGLKRPEAANRIYRCLKTSFKAEGASLKTSIKLIRHEMANRRVGMRVLREVQPELIYVWNARHISSSILFAAQRRGCRICYFVSDYWLAEWQPDSWYLKHDGQPRRFLTRLVWRTLRFLLFMVRFEYADQLDLSHVQFASRFLKESALRAGKSVAAAEVIHWGVNLERFPFNKSRAAGRRLLYVGQLITNKGVHTAIEALKLVRERSGDREIMLTIAGGPDYDGRLHRMMNSLGLDRNITWAGQVPRAQIPIIYQEHDTLIFPSVWDEPFSLTLLEAMSSGVAVVSTATGGTPELLLDEANALIFPIEDPDACAQRILELQKDPKLHERIRMNGRQTVEERFRFEDMIDKIENSLRRVHADERQANLS